MSIQLVTRVRPCRLRWVTWSALVLSVLCPSHVAGQEGAPLKGSIDFRYSSHTSHALYGAYDIGVVVMWVGMVQGSRTDYRETVGGVARSVGRGRVRATLALTAAHASESWYAQVYLVPAVRLGPVGVSGILEAYVPLGPSGNRQFHVSPLNALVPLTRRVRVGASYTLAAQAGSDAIHRIGPALQVLIGGTAVTVTVLSGAGPATGDVRVYASAPW